MISSLLISPHTHFAVSGVDTDETQLPRVKYFEYMIPHGLDAQALLYYALESGLLASDYMLYRAQDEVLIAGNPFAHVRVGKDVITLTYADRQRRTPAVAPFAQIPKLLATLPVEGWRIYGYIGFDIARFYYPYYKAMDYPLLDLFVPSFEARLTPDQTLIRSLQPLAQLDELIRAASPKDRGRQGGAAGHNGHGSVQVTLPTFDPAQQIVYEDRVASLIQAIQRDELHKAIISRQVTVDGKMDLLRTYDLSLKQNTGARSYCMKLGEVGTVGFSPEILMAVDGNGIVMTNPLAATRARGLTEEHDRQLRNELFSDAKEVKEHALSVWLAQSEIESICLEGSGRIYDFMDVKRYRTVQHLSSRVSGLLRPNQTLWDGLKALFPGITVSGIDKTSALKWIDRLEDRPRGVYAGGIGWIDDDGTAELAITLRSIYQYGEQVVFQAGAGIVGESRTHLEYKETVNRMKTMLNSLVME